MRDKRLIIEALAIVVAVFSVSFGLIVWWLDGAWHYSAFPTEGVVRTTMIGAGGIVLIFIGRLLARLRK